VRGQGRRPLTYPGPLHMPGFGGLLLPPEQGKGSLGASSLSVPPPSSLSDSLGSPRKACLRLWPLTSVLGHNAQPVPGTPAQGLLGAGFGAGSQTKVLALPCPKPRVLQPDGDEVIAVVPLGLCLHSPVGYGTSV
jgi:hypothetical protein